MVPNVGPLISDDSCTIDEEEDDCDEAHESASGDEEDPEAVCRYILDGIVASIAEKDEAGGAVVKLGSKSSLWSVAVMLMVLVGLIRLGWFPIDPGSFAAFKAARNSSLVLKPTHPLPHRTIGVRGCTSSSRAERLFGWASTVDAASTNDDYCDCVDSSDETTTAACAGADAAVFTCRAYQFEGSRLMTQVIPASKVDDGVCDCCDGSDELSSREWRARYPIAASTGHSPPWYTHNKGGGLAGGLGGDGGCPHTCAVEAEARASALLEEAAREEEAFAVKVNDFCPKGAKVLATVAGNLPLVEKAAGTAKLHFEEAQKALMADPRGRQNYQGMFLLQKMRSELQQLMNSAAKSRALLSMDLGDDSLLATTMTIKKKNVMVGKNNHNDKAVDSILEVVEGGTGVGGGGGGNRGKSHDHDTHPPHQTTTAEVVVSARAGHFQDNEVEVSAGGSDDGEQGFLAGRGGGAIGAGSGSFRGGNVNGNGDGVHGTFVKSNAGNAWLGMLGKCALSKLLTEKETKGGTSNVELEHFVFVVCPFENVTQVRVKTRTNTELTKETCTAASTGVDADHSSSLMHLAEVPDDPYYDWLVQVYGHAWVMSDNRGGMGSGNGYISSDDAKIVNSRPNETATTNDAVATGNGEDHMARNSSSSSSSSSGRNDTAKVKRKRKRKRKQQQVREAVSEAQWQPPPAASYTPVVLGRWSAWEVPPPPSRLPINPHFPVSPPVFPAKAAAPRNFRWDFFSKATTAVSTVTVSAIYNKKKEEDNRQMWGSPLDISLAMRPLDRSKSQAPSPSSPISERRKSVTDDDEKSSDASRATHGGSAVMRFKHGDGCKEGAERSVALYFECGPAMAVTTVHEDGLCTYLVTMATPAACSHTRAAYLRQEAAAVYVAVSSASTSS